MVLMDFIKQHIGLDYAVQYKIFTSIIIILSLYILKKIVQWFAFKKIKSAESRYFWGKAFTYIEVTVILLLLIKVWFQGLKPLATYFGLVSAGMAIALKDIFTDIAGWIFILIKKPFSIGDRVQIGNFKGDVVDIRVFQFSLVEIGVWVDAEQSTGRIVNIPNSLIFNEPLANYTKGFRFVWNEIPVLVTFESNWEKAKKILLEIVKERGEEVAKIAEKEIKKATIKYYIHYSVLTPTVYTKVVDSGVLLTLRYLCEVRKRRNSENELWEEILKEFGKHDDIDFAYPTYRYYNNLLEGKEGTKPKPEPEE